MKFYLISLAIFLVVWIVAWFAFIRPMLKKYAVTSGLLERIEATEGGLWKRFAIWFEAKKTVVVAFILSALSEGKAALDHSATTLNGIQATDLQPLQDKGLWSAVIGDVYALHIVSAISIVIAFLTLKGKLTALLIVPKTPAA